MWFSGYGVSVLLVVAAVKVAGGATAGGAGGGVGRAYTVVEDFNVVRRGLHTHATSLQDCMRL